MLPRIAPVDFVIWGKSGEAVAAREHLEQKTIRFAHVVGNQGAGFVGASFTDAFRVIRRDKILPEPYYDHLYEDWKRLVRLTSFWGKLTTDGYRTRLYRRVCDTTNWMEFLIQDHLHQSDQASV